MQARDFGYSSAGTGVVVNYYYGQDAVVVIPEQLDGKDVIAIGSDIFRNHPRLNEVHIPRTVYNIKVALFHGLKDLTAIHVDDRNTTFRSVDGVLLDAGEIAVFKCPEAKAGDCVLPDSVRQIEDRAFEGCHALTRIALGPQIFHLRDEVFEGCSSLEAIDVSPDNPAFSSQDGVLYEKQGLSLIRYPRGKSGVYHMPAALRGFHSWAFRACTRLTAIEVAPDHPQFSSVDGVLFDKAATTLIKCPGGKPGVFTVPATTTGIDEDAFTACVALTAIEAEPGGVFQSRDGLLYGEGFGRLVRCPAGLTGAVSIHDNTSEYFPYAFEGCSRITTLRFGPAASGLWGFAVPYNRDLLSLTAIEIAADNPLFSSFDGVLYTKDRSILIACPRAKAGTCIIADETITITEFGWWAFQGCSQLTRVVVGQNLDNTSPLSTVFYLYFQDSPLLEAIDVHPLNPIYSSIDGLVYNREGTALKWCPPGRSGEIVIPDAVTQIYDGALDDCPRLTRIVIGEGVTGHLPFLSGCPGLTSLVIGRGIAFPAEGWFDFSYDNKQLASIEVSPAHPTHTSLDGIVYNKDLTEIVLCPPAKGGHVTIADTATSMQYGAFRDCVELTGVRFGQNLGQTPELWTFYFENCPRLAAIDVHPLNASYSSIEGVLYNKDQTVLQWCPPARAEELVIPDSVTKIEIYAIHGCPLLTRIVMGNGLTGENDIHFSDCAGLTSFVIGQRYFSFEDPVMMLLSPVPPGLASVEVHPLNEAFSSVEGVLYNKNRTTLFRWPPGKTGRVTIPATVSQILDRTFEGRTALDAIYFEGDNPEFNHVDWSHFDDTIVYFLPDTQGWEETFGGLPTAVWEPAVSPGSVTWDPASGEFGFAIEWSGDRSVIVEAGSDLTPAGWMPAATVTLEDGIGVFTTPASTDRPAQFYRVRRP